MLGMNGEVAYDFYLVYGPEAKWTSSPPNPDYIMHKIVEHAPRGHFLNFGKLTNEIRKQLTKAAH